MSDVLGNPNERDHTQDRGEQLFNRIAELCGSYEAAQKDTLGATINIIRESQFQRLGDDPALAFQYGKRDVYAATLIYLTLVMMEYELGGEFGPNDITG